MVRKFIFLKTDVSKKLTSSYFFIKRGRSPTRIDLRNSSLRPKGHKNVKQRLNLIHGQLVIILRILSLSLEVRLILSVKYPSFCSNPTPVDDLGQHDGHC